MGLQVRLVRNQGGKVEAPLTVTLREASLDFRQGQLTESGMYVTLEGHIQADTKASVAPSKGLS